MFSRSANDNKLYWTEKFIKDCDIDGYYMDNLFCRLNSDPIASAAYLLPDGRVQPAYDLWGQRDFVRRLRVTFEKYRNPVGICIHNTDYQFAPVMGYADLAMGGENPLPVMGTPDYMDMYPRAWMDVMYNQPLWGYQLSHLFHFDYPSFKTDSGDFDRPAALKSLRTMMASMLVHGVEFWQGIEYSEYLMGRYKLFKMLPGELTFLPSWKSHGLFYVANGDPDLDVAVYQKQNALLIIAANYGKQAKRADIRMDFPRLLPAPGPYEFRALHDFETLNSPATS